MRCARWSLYAALLVALGALRAPVYAEDEFPAHGLLPKADTGADRFLAKHPEYDGRGVIVAIFDTGVDPGAPGLQTTTDGKPKIVDVVDGSGSGDVDTSTVRKAKDGALEGLSGRTLKVEGLVCPTGEFHVGVKRAYDLFPRGLVPRLKKKRRKAWDAAQRAAAAALVQQVTAFKDAHADPKGDDKKTLEDLELRLEQLRGLQEDYEDPGPIFDCVVFHDGTHWRAVVDTDEDGELAEEKALADYRIERQYATFGKEDLLNYAINVYEKGNLLSIVADSGAHGTHVAGIVAGHFPDQPDLNGVAPGAQIVAVKIGDTRLDSSSTGTGEERGLIAVLRNGCDLINMSYGGPTPTPNKGHMARLYSEIVNKHGVIFVASAGNEGPALTTVGAPGGTTSAIFGIGATISPEMMKAQYSLRKRLPANYFTWSSRGPTVDGALGVDFSAPGGAIAPVPNWSLQKTMQMNGTSMSSPNACGGIALVRSAMKAQAMPYSPTRVRRALENTAVPVEGVDVFGVGRGVIQIDRAFEYLEAHRDAQGEDVRFEVTLPRLRDARGVYLREPHEIDRVLETRVAVNPLFHEDADNRRRVDFQMQIALESTRPWIEAPEHMLLMHGGRTFEIRVDPTALKEEGAYYGEVRGYDSTNRARGPLFRVPVTVVKPRAVSPEEGFGFREQMILEPGEIRRRFVAVPVGATWADLTLRAGASDTSKLFVVQTMQILPGRGNLDGRFERYLRLKPGEVEGLGIAVTGGRTMELAMAQYWSSLGAGSVEVSLHFHGLEPDRSPIVLDGADLVTRIDVTAPFRKEEIEPRAKLDVLRKRIRPARVETRPLDPDRDKLPEERLIHESILTYEIELDEDATVTPRSMLASEDGLWESFSSTLWMLFDSSGRYVRSGSAGGAKVELEEGSYELKMHLRHEDPQRLEAVKDAVLFLDFALEDAISLKAFASGEEALAGSPAFGKRALAARERVALFLRGPSAKQMPDGAEAGDELRGTVTFGAPNEREPGPGKRPDGFVLQVAVPPSPTEADEEDDEEEEAAEEGKAERDTMEEVQEKLRDGMVDLLRELRKQGKKEAFESLAKKILASHARHLPVHLERLRLAYGDGPPYEDATTLRRVEEAANAVLALIDRRLLAEHFGTKHDAEDPAARRHDKEMKERRDALKEALHKKGAVLAASGPSHRSEFETIYKELARWADMEETPYVWLTIEHEKQAGRLGRALQLFDAAIEEEDADRKHHEGRAALYEALGWKHWADHERTWLILRFPAGRSRF